MGRIYFRDLVKTIGLGIVRPGDERATHFCAVPSGFDAKSKRLFDRDAARRQVLHERSPSCRRSTIERYQGLDLLRGHDFGSAVVGQSREIGKYGGHEVAMMRVSGRETCCV